MHEACVIVETIPNIVCQGRSFIKIGSQAIIETHRLVAVSGKREPNTALCIEMPFNNREPIFSQQIRPYNPPMFTLNMISVLQFHIVAFQSVLRVWCAYHLACFRVKHTYIHSRESAESQITPPLPHTSGRLLTFSLKYSRVFGRKLSSQSAESHKSPVANSTPLFHAMCLPIFSCSK